MAAASSAGPGLGSPPLSTLAAMAPAPLAAAPEQALRAEASETASEPDRLFAPDFIISQVCFIMGVVDLTRIKSFLLPCSMRFGFCLVSQLLSLLQLSLV